MINIRAFGVDPMRLIFIEIWTPAYTIMTESIDGYEGTGSDLTFKEHVHIELCIVRMTTL